MSIMTRLALKQLRANPRRTLMTVLGIILSVSMLVALSGFIASFQSMLRDTYISFGGDWHVSFSDVTEKQIADIMQDAQTEGCYTQAYEEGTALLFRLRQPSTSFADTAAEIAARHGVNAESILYNRELLMVEGHLSQDPTMLVLYVFGGILMLIVLAGSVLVISNAFRISATERIRQFGLLKSIGATKRQIQNSVVAEGLLLSGLAIPCGIALGYLVEIIALSIANVLLKELNAINNGLFHFEAVFSPGAIAFASVLAFITILFSAWLPARRVSRESPLDAIRLTKEVKLKASRIGTPRFIQVIFGFEGVLAHKTLRRNSSKYRATVVALVVSMVLYVGGTSFGTYMLKTSNTYYRDYGINTVITLHDGTITSHEALGNELAIRTGETFTYVYCVQLGLTQDMLPPSQLENADLSGVNTLNMCGINDAEFESICRAVGIKANGAPFGILVDATGMDFDLSGIYRTGLDTHEGINVAIAGVIQEIPTQLMGCYTPPRWGINVVVPESYLSTLLPEDASCSAVFYTWAEDGEDFHPKVSALLESHMAQDNYMVNDLDAMARMNKSISQLLMVFIYGFIGMLSLIAVTSVIATISTGIALRRQEFALISSVGMTREGIRKMLNFESLFYGLKALMAGIPLSLLVSWLLFRALHDQFQFAYVPPVLGLLVSIVAVMGLSFATMAYSRKKLGTESIVDAIKRDVA